MLQLHDSANMRGPSAKLDEDFRRGFSTAVYNNQPLLALKYAEKIIDELDSKIDFLMKMNEKTVPKTVKTTKAVTEEKE